MGYILPLNHEQYTQYANRTIRKDTSGFKLAPVQRVTIRTKLKGKTNYEDKYEEIKQLQDGNSKEIERVETTGFERDDLDEKDLAELTGKGTLFNEVI
ncbi:hypothetical protein [Calidifontibacillus oryziterrae]|uniref:hypothetical protein n=1 Tax=Calidifontibacillus oryziterrae TaxID=1191699 RepID=UPI0002D82432|nr:hypothetical protein [Calidifontibacillus oryziterrae]